MSPFEAFEVYLGREMVPTCFALQEGLSRHPWTIDIGFTSHNPWIAGLMGTMFRPYSGATLCLGHGGQLVWCRNDGAKSFGVKDQGGYGALRDRGYWGSRKLVNLTKEIYFKN